ncbi:zinc-binding dehydrogenase [Paenibacillus sacheonensis]|uniref:Zinc-binding dehydrogenase n=1 Tax=Paenibacillus sacheonensis TaxID=742054 RepID=A0A7X5C1R4_9BACL|nr:zinc-binding dehydrogenase [Paenibacillus sacheonensis]MBM7569197.1 2-desacetyl-2-hydroxyethyl bacteriochlorophyllide A dehydrogenase [Paenibacillus sacheonensis]NBC73022.1 zinc-binding dehydrogenase [Paenibacillus sacheonensis]
MSEKAIVFQARNEVRLIEVDVPLPMHDEVQVRTIKSMISAGTERWILSDRFSRAGTPFPCIPGYQRVGVVEKVGKDVRDINIGDRVIATSGMSVPGIASNWGAHLSLGNTKSGEIYRIPDNVGDEDASGIVVVQVGYNAASRLLMKEKDWVVIYGDGIIGQCASQAARARGARTILVGRRTERLAIGGKHSADFVVNAAEGSVAKRVQEITKTAFVTGVLDTVQNEEAGQSYMPLLEPGYGQIVYCGHSTDRAWVDMALLQAHGFTCHFVSDWTRTRIEATLSLMNEGAIRLAPLITHRGNCEEAPLLYQMLIDNKEPFLGMTIDWSVKA